MILIWDNGEVYSDHCVSFIDCERWPVQDCITLMGLYDYQSGFVVALVEKLDWREGHLATIDTIANGLQLNDFRKAYNIVADEKLVLFLLDKKIEHYKERGLRLEELQALRAELTGRRARP
jgi:hypothetical protein